MGETLKSTVKNKFKKVAENELNILIEVIYQVEMDKLSKLQGLFGQSWNLKFVIKEYDGKIYEVTCEMWENFDREIILNFHTEKNVINVTKY